ncbi:MAG: hypothetical protein RLZZ336_414 [Cyanobacteriota bacterium]|jgi:hypothetical protein
MLQRIRTLLITALVTGIDLYWGWYLSTYAQSWMFQLLGASGLEVKAYYHSVLEPRLWIQYAVVLTAQLTWVILIAPSPLSHQKLRMLWWLGVAVVIAGGLILRLGLTLSAGASLLLLGVQIGDLLLLYWLATRLLTPKPQRKVIPGWW